METRKKIQVKKVCDEVRGKCDSRGLCTAKLLLQRIRLEVTDFTTLKLKVTS